MHYFWLWYFTIYFPSNSIEMLLCFLPLLVICVLPMLFVHLPRVVAVIVTQMLLEINKLKLWVNINSFWIWFCLSSVLFQGIHFVSTLLVSEICGFCNMNLFIGFLLFIQLIDRGMFWGFGF